MDLYSAGMSISAGGQVSQNLSQANNINTEFNRGLKEKRDAIKETAQQQGSQYATLNIAKETPLVGKFLTNSALRDAAIKGVKDVPSTLVKAPIGLATKVFGKVPVPVTTGVQSTKTLQDAGALESSRESGQAILDSAKGGKVALDVGEDIAKVSATTAAKTLVAGAGIGLEVFKDYERGGVGNNWEQQVGGVLGFVGGGLQVAGLLTAWTGAGLGVEALGTAISIGGGALEAAGDIKDQGDQEDQADQDVTSQLRGNVATEQITQVLARSN